MQVVVELSKVNQSKGRGVPSNMFEGTNVLVTGGSGFVGTNLIRELVQRKSAIRATIHERPPWLAHPRVDYVKADLTKPGDCASVVKGMDYVFMCAASTSGAGVISSDPLRHVTPNVVMNARMLEAAYREGVRKFIWISSSVVYPPSGERRVKESEGMRGSPNAVYFASGWMKRYTEILCKLYSERLQRTMPTVVIRPSNIYGPYDKFDPGTSHVTASLVKRVAERSAPIQVWGDGNDIRDLIYVDDLVRGLLLAAEKLEGYDPVNICAGKGYSVRNVLHTLLELEGYRHAEVMFDRSKPSMIHARLIDGSKARSLLGFEATVPLRVGLSRTLQWYKENVMTSGRGKVRKSRS